MGHFRLIVKIIFKHKRIAMKKILLLGLILSLFAAAASAQQSARPRFRHQEEMRTFHRRELTKSELRRLHKDEMRYRMARRKARADGVVTRAERRRLAKLEKHNHRELYHFTHNKQRVI